MGIEGQFLNRGFAFQAPAWGRCRLHEVMLRKVFRQQSDQKFLRILQDIRCGAGPPCQVSSAPGDPTFYAVVVQQLRALLSLRGQSTGCLNACLLFSSIC